MQAVILAAGFGSRLGVITQGKPKSFLKINNETLIDRAVRLLKERGITDIHVVTGYRDDLMVQKLTDSVTFHHNPLYFCTNVLASFSVAMPSLSDPFIFLHADTVFEESILDMLLEANGDIVLPIDFKDVEDEEMKVIIDDKRNVLEISKDIEWNNADGEFMGLAKVSSGALEILKRAVEEELSEKKLLQSYFEGAIQNLIEKGFLISTIDISNYNWVEIDFESDYETAQRIFGDI